MAEPVRRLSNWRFLNEPASWLARGIRQCRRKRVRRRFARFSDLGSGSCLAFGGRKKRRASLNVSARVIDLEVKRT